MNLKDFLITIKKLPVTHPAPKEFSNELCLRYYSKIAHELIDCLDNEADAKTALKEIRSKSFKKDISSQTKAPLR